MTQGTVIRPQDSEMVEEVCKYRVVNGNSLEETISVYDCSCGVCDSCC